MARTPLASEPALSFGVLAAAIVAILGAFGVVIDINTVELVIVTAVPLLTAIFTRFFVTPTGKG